MIKKRIESIDATLKSIDAKLDALAAKVDALAAGQKELLAIMACLPRVFSIVATGLREAAAGGKVRAMVAASPVECAQWLIDVDYGLYVAALAPLGGATLLMQTPASLRLAGVAPIHVQPLLDKIVAAALAPPSTDVRDKS